MDSVLGFATDVTLKPSKYKGTKAVKEYTALRAKGPKSGKEVMPLVRRNPNPLNFSQKHLTKHLSPREHAENQRDGMVSVYGLQGLEDERQAGTLGRVVVPGTGGHLASGLATGGNSRGGFSGAPVDPAGNQIGPPSKYTDPATHYAKPMGLDERERQREAGWMERYVSLQEMGEKLPPFNTWRAKQSKL